MTLEVLFVLLDNIYSTVTTHDDNHMFIAEVIDILNTIMKLDMPLASFNKQQKHTSLLHLIFLFKIKVLWDWA